MRLLPAAFLLFALGLAACTTAEPTLLPPEPLPPEVMPSPTPGLAPTQGRQPPTDGFGQPPQVMLEVDGRSQAGRLGTYCWTEPDRGGLCADTAGIATAREPLVVSSPLALRFHFDPAFPPDTAWLRIFRALPSQSTRRSGDTLEWPSGSGPTYELTGGLEMKQTLELEPGLYVFSLFAVWQTRGDAVYGFLVRVD